VNSVVSTV